MAMNHMGDERLALLKDLMDLIKDAPKLLDTYRAEMDALDQRYRTDIASLQTRYTEGLAKVEADVNAHKAALESDLGTLKREVKEARMAHTGAMEAMTKERESLKAAIEAAQRTHRLVVESLEKEAAKRRDETAAILADYDKQIGRKREELRLLKEALKRAAAQAEA